MSGWHADHRATLLEYQRRVSTGERLILAAHALLECYSVLTRLPRPNRVDPGAAVEAIQQTFSAVSLATLSSGHTWSLLGEAPARQIGGGRIYDAAIALAVFEAGARVFLTWNVRDLVAVAPAGLEIRAPRPIPESRRERK